MKLHVFPPSPNARKCLVTAQEAGVTVETVMVDLVAGDQRKPEFLALNPNGKMPVLEYDDGTTLWESNAICNRLADLGGSDLFPRSDARFPIVQWQFWEMAHFAPATSAFVAKTFFQREIDETAATEALHTVAKVLDGELAKRDWLVGDAISTADICVASTLCYRDYAAMPLDGFKNIDAWMQRLEARPAWAAANPAMEPA